MRIVPNQGSRPDSAARASATDRCRPWPRFAVRIAIAAGVAATLAGPPATAASAVGCDTAFASNQALPAVVNISVIRVLPTKDAAANKVPDMHFELFVGSGAIIDPSGIIVTNKHVIQDAATIRVTFHDRSQLRAQLIAAAGLVDLALLKVVSPKPLPILSFGNSDEVRVGQPVIAVGNPLGVGTSVTTGVVSAVNRNLMRTPFDDFIQTDAALNPGNSGGPLLDCSGSIIGIDTALLSNNSLLGSIGLGFAMPSNDVKFVTDMLRDPANSAPNWIGLHLQDLTESLASVFHRPTIAGAIVTRVEPNSPAAHASLSAGDIILGVRGEEMPELARRAARPGGGSIRTANIAVGLAASSDKGRDDRGAAVAAHGGTARRGSGQLRKHCNSRVGRPGLAPCQHHAGRSQEIRA